MIRATPRGSGGASLFRSVPLSFGDGHGYLGSDAGPGSLVNGSSRELKAIDSAKGAFEFDSLYLHARV